MVEELDSSSFKRVKNGLIVCQIFAILQCIALVVLTFYWKHVRDGKLIPWQPDIEIPFSTVVHQNTDELPESFKKLHINHNETAYVGSPSDVFTALSQLAVTKHFNADPYPEQFNIVTPRACHDEEEKPRLKMSKVKALVKVGASNHSKIIWEDEEDRFGNELNYTNGDVIVDQDGYFFVTSHIVSECKPEGDNSTRVDKPLRVHVFVQSNGTGDARCLLENAKSKCDRFGDKNLIFSSIGAVFKLNKNDRLYVAISYNESEFNVTGQSVSNYLALYGT